MILKLKLTPEQIGELFEYCDGKYDVCIRYDTEIHNTCWQRSTHIDPKNLDLNYRNVEEHLINVMKEQNLVSDADIEKINQIWSKGRDPNRIQPVLDEIGRIWKRYPDLRLGQLIVNTIHDPKRLYNIEESALIEELKAFEKKVQLDE